MQLIQWLEKEKKTVADMARDLDLSHTVVLRWVHKKRIPRAEFMQKIIAYTKGEVQPNDFYGEADENIENPN